jgi:hypothetical protein
MSLPPVTRPHDRRRTVRPASAAHCPANRPEVLSMTALVLDMSMSLDGFVTGPRPRAEAPLGERS